MPDFFWSQTPFAFLPMVGFFGFFFLIALWSILITGYALWVSARSGQKWWFVAFLFIHTLGILEIIYLVWFSPKGSNRLNPSHQSAPTPADTSSPQE